MAFFLFVKNIFPIISSVIAVFHTTLADRKTYKCKIKWSPCFALLFGEDLEMSVENMLEGVMPESRECFYFQIRFTFFFQEGFMVYHGFITLAF